MRVVRWRGGGGGGRGGGKEGEAVGSWSCFTHEFMRHVSVLCKKLRTLRSRDQLLQEAYQMEFEGGTQSMLISDVSFQFQLFSWAASQIEQKIYEGETDAE